MKRKVLKQILSTLLALIMVIGLIPTTALTAFAAGKTEVAQIETRISAEYVPYAGRKYTDLYTYVDTSIYGSAQASGSDWVDDAGVTIEVKGNGDYGEWYDIRYQFEAGRTYTAVYTYMINTLYEDTYKFTENTMVTLANPDPLKCTITGEVIEVRDSGRICDVRYTMTIAGERSYPDIKSATLQKITTPADGIEVETTALMYNNCTLTSQSWSPDVSTFAAGNTYTLTVNLHAKDGYKFADDFAPVLGIEGYEKAADNVVLLNNNEDAAVSFTYAVGDYSYVDTLQFVTNWPYSTYVPTRETSGQPMNFPFAPDDGVPFENRNNALGYVDNTYWYNETDGYEMDYTKTFEAGKVYSLSTVFDIKKDLLGEYRFADNATAVINGPGFSPSGYQVECVPNGTSIIVKFLFTGQFPGDEGSTAYDPAMCYSYAEFKYAMENKDIRYVALGFVEEMLPAIPHDEEQNPGGITTNAIVVRGTKDLNLLGNAVFKCPLTNNYDLKYYTELMTLTSVADSNLYIHGEGSLTYEAGNLYFFNSAIKVAGGSLTVDGATVCGSNGYHTGYCYGINALYGGVAIQGGATIIGEVYNGDGVCALSVGEEGLNQSLSVSIWDGKFYVDRDVEDGNHDYGIAVNNDVGLRIYGGSFEGIDLGRYAADNLDEYVMDGCTMTINGQKVNPASYSTIDGKIVEVYTEISKVDIHVNSPVAGKNIPFYVEDVYMVPEGCTVKDITWYENNGAVSTSWFIAGNTYKVEIVLTADDGVKFANPLTSATVNYKTAEVSAHAGNAETGIVLTVDLGECADTISEVALTVTAPVEGNTPSYTVGCGSETYYAVGGSSNYSDYRKWYMSSDNDEWWEINETHTFMPGYYYKFVTEIRTNNGYEFPLIDNGTIEPNVSATVNGYYADVYKAYEQDPSRHIAVEYNFGECNDSVVDNVIIYNVTEPVAGEKPSYTYSISGSGYQMDTGRNAYYDDWMHNQKLYYVKNGISWWDVTDGGYEYVYENDSFIPGHEYQCKVYLKTEDGFEFANDDGTPTVSATMNGKVAGVKMFGSNLMWEQEVTYTFVCKQPEVKTVMLYDLDEPKSGETPDTDVTSAYPEYYEVTEVKWLDEEDGEVEEFEQGRLYTVEITVSPKDYDGEDGCVFAEEAVAYIDGKEVTGWSNRVTVNNDNTLTVRYQFRKGASAPENILYVFVTQPRGGELKAGETHNASWETSFVPDKAEIQYWDGEEWSQWDIYEPENASDSYSFESSEAAAYRFRVVVYAEEAAVATSNEFTVSWEEAENEINYGDVNADGKVDRKDLTRLAQYFARWNVEINTTTSDANGDGKIDRKDLTRLAQYFARWDVELGK